MNGVHRVEVLINGFIIQDNGYDSNLDGPMTNQKFIM